MFPSPEWLTAWAGIANEDARFGQAGRGWKGAVGLVIEPVAGVAEPPVYMRLDGFDGQWTAHALGSDAALLDGTLFTLSAAYLVWKRVIRQEIEPVRGVIQGQIRVHGHLSSLLRWTGSLRLMTELAGQLETTFADDGPS